MEPDSFAKTLLQLHFQNATPPSFMKNALPSAEQPSMKAKNKKQIAQEMGIHPNTLTRRLKDAGLYIPRGFVSPQQQVEIYRRLGWCEKM